MKRKRKTDKRKIYKAVQWTWGLPQTLLGAGLYLIHKEDRHFDYNGAKVTAWKKDTGVSLGRYLFVPEREGRLRSRDDQNGVSRFLLEHEYGHSIQSLALGPLYLLLIGAPSLVWNRLPYFRHRREKTGKSYYSAVFERTASELGEKSRKRKDASS